jgi:hypothetical protein
MVACFQETVFAITMPIEAWLCSVSNRAAISAAKRAKELEEPIVSMYLHQ